MSSKIWSFLCFPWKKIRKTEKRHEILDRAMSRWRHHVKWWRHIRKQVTQSSAGEIFWKSLDRNIRNLLCFRSYAAKSRPWVFLVVWVLTLIGTRFSPHVKNQGGGKKTPQRKICNISGVWRPILMKFSQCLARWIPHTTPLKYFSYHVRWPHKSRSSQGHTWKKMT